MDFDREAVLASFLIETEEGLDLMEQSLLEMESNPNDAELLPNVFRVAHTLKGNATSLGYKELAGFAHVVEDLLDVFRQQQAMPGPDVLSVLLRVVDELRAMVPAVAAGTRELTPKQQELRKQIAQEVGTRSKRVVTPSATSSENSSTPRADSLPGSNHRTLRADVDKLDRILNLTGEIVIAQGRLRQMIEKLGTEEGRALLEMHREAERLYMDLQGEVMGIRLVPVGPLFRQFVRSVRDLARSQGKLARLEVVGADVEVDTTVLEHLKDPLLHLVRNAIDHGLEEPSLRESHGKKACGVIRLSATHSGGNVIVQLQDDGAGFNRVQILEKAKRMGVLSGKNDLSNHDLYDLVFQPGFSTAESVTEISGRGVGLDVVRRNIDAMRGTVEISSEEGKGTTITVTLPLTLTIIRGFSVTVSDETFVVPLEYVTECTELPAEQRSSEAYGILNLRGKALPYVRLRDLFDISGELPKREHIVVVKMNQFHAGIAVDQLLGDAQTVVKPLGRALRGVAGVAGSTVLGDGRVGLIVDVPSLLRGLSRSNLQLQSN
ncbi:MAG TPA: chemotaxis protein CheA [Terriglobales bacterium]|nr:chemotaxis protein CheA [Terriglobales bacterium]